MFLKVEQTKAKVVKKKENNKKKITFRNAE